MPDTQRRWNPPNLRAGAAARDGKPIDLRRSRHGQDDAQAGTLTGDAAIVETRCNGSRWRGHAETCAWYVPTFSLDRPARSLDPGSSQIQARTRPSRTSSSAPIVIAAWIRPTW